MYASMDDQPREHTRKRSVAVCRDTPYEVSCFTYGCPRVGNDRFAARFKEQVPKTFRVYNRLDLVPQVPWFLGYTHPPSEVRLDADSRLYLPQDNKVSVFGDGLVTEQARLPVSRYIVVVSVTITSSLCMLRGHCKGQASPQAQREATRRGRHWRGHGRGPG